MKKYLLIIAAILGITTSCDNYLDINQDPNSPTESNITSSMILPGAEMNLAASYGDFLRIVGGYYAQQYAHDFGTSNYLDYSKFIMSATRSSGTYSQLTSRCLKNLETVRTLSKAKEEWGTYLAATVLRGFTFQVLVDCYGETPYTEALDAANLTPHYDDGLTIYNGVLSEIDEALSHATASSLVCTNMLFPSANASKWIQLANALKLKMLMRMSNTQDVKSKLAALVQENNFPTEDVAWKNCWADESGKANPFYQEEFATYFGSTQINICLNLALLKTMQESEDARLAKFFSANGSGNYTGGVSGSNFSTSTTYKSDYWCRPTSAYNDPVYLISVSEIEFFLAEYYARYGTASNAETHYKAAVDASFAMVGATGADKIYTTYYPWKNANYKQIIGVQKWVALSGYNNFESWCELRRLDYPAFGTVTGDQLYNESNDVYTPSALVTGTLYTPIHYNTDLGKNKILQRFPYAESSANRNANTPADKGDATPVFWAE